MRELIGLTVFAVHCDSAFSQLIVTATAPPSDLPRGGRPRANAFTARRALGPLGRDLVRVTGGGPDLRRPMDPLPAPWLGWAAMGPEQHLPFAQPTPRGDLPLRSSWRDLRFPWRGPEEGDVTGPFPPGPYTTLFQSVDLEGRVQPHEPAPGRRPYDLMQITSNSIKLGLEPDPADTEFLRRASKHAVRRLWWSAAHGLGYVIGHARGGHRDQQGRFKITNIEALIGSVVERATRVSSSASDPHVTFVLDTARGTTTIAVEHAQPLPPSRGDVEGEIAFVHTRLVSEMSYAPSSAGTLAGLPPKARLVAGICLDHEDCLQNAELARACSSSSPPNQEGNLMTDPKEVR